MKPAARMVRYAFACKGCKKGFHHHVGNAVRLAQAAPARLSGCNRGVLQRSEGKSALALSRDLHLSYKSAFVLLHKLREAMAEEMRGRVVGGEGKQAEIDGGYLAAYIKPANYKEDRKDRRPRPQPKRQAQGCRHYPRRGGASVPAVFASESAAVSFIRARIAKGPRSTRMKRRLDGCMNASK